jgi:hypothetical protein
MSQRFNSLAIRRALATLSLASSTLAVSFAHAAMPTDPVHDTSFLTLPDGRDLKSVKVSGTSLSLTHGTGQAFGPSQKAAYEKIKSDSKNPANKAVQWVLMDLDKHLVIDSSGEPTRRIFGASVAKVFAAATLLDKQQGQISKDQLQVMSNMLVISSNTAWLEIQKDAGNGDADRGREANYEFTQRMGYSNTRGFQGSWNKMHGNELNASELAQLMYDIYHGAFPGAEVEWKVMHTGRTGASRAKKYLPTGLIVGGKTGTYDGPSINPETGGTTGANGKPYSVKVRNQVVVFNAGGHEYAIAILADTGSDETAALLAGGLLREYIGNRR